MQNEIEKVVVLNAPIERVWDALTDYRQFGEWFGVKLGEPFKVGEKASGQLTFEGMEHITWDVTIVAMKKPRLFSFSGHPNASDPDEDYSKEPETTVEFLLEKVADGTRLTIRETGFAALPKGRGDTAYRENKQGWDAQAQSLADYLNA